MLEDKSLNIAMALVSTSAASLEPVDCVLAEEARLLEARGLLEEVDVLEVEALVEGLGPPSCFLSLVDFSVVLVMSTILILLPPF